MKVEYINHMGDDLTVVDAARVSFDKKSEWQTWYEEKNDINGKGYQVANRKLFDKDQKLINYLAKHKHWTPFAHPQIQLRITVPIFIANQLKRHQVGLALNEISKRYIDTEPEFYTPDEWRGRPEGSIKQGSSEEVISEMQVDAYTVTFHCSKLEYKDSPTHVAHNVYWHAKEAYNAMLKAGIAPEQVRMVLPQAMYTSWIWTGSLAAFARVCKQRLDPHAQKESQEVAQMISDIIAPLFPVSWKALKENY